MYHYLQFRPDKKERWHFMSEEQLEKVEQPPAFISVLKVDQDVGALEDAGEDSLEEAKYKGPMYFDLDSEDDIDAVLQSSRDLLAKLKSQLGIPADYIRCWLSGGKGVHFTIDERIFGIKRATKYLPYIYHEIAKMVEVPYLDMNVYSAGRGRLWRCPGVKRHGKNVYKVPVSLEELETMDAQTYEVLCSNPRPEFDVPEIPDNLSIAKAEVAFKKAKQAATRRVKAIKNAKVVPTEELRKLSETPGCVQKLVTEGDSGDSNWNQAAMQVAAWIAARYSRDEEEEYTRDIIDPFIKNVESSNRPSEKERRKHLKDQINRAFGGKTKFAVGPLIKTIGEACHDCPLCRGDLEFEEPKPEEGVQGFSFFDKETNVIAKETGYLQSRGENKPRQLTSFTFWPHTLVMDYEETSPGVYESQGTISMTGKYVTGKTKLDNYSIPTELWSSSAQLRKKINAVGGAVYASDTDLQNIFQAINDVVVREDDGSLKDGITEMAEVGYCGIILEKQKAKGGKIRHIPHYVEEGSAITPTRTGAMESKFRFRQPGREQGDLSPRLLDEEFPFEDDTDLIDVLKGLIHMNEPTSMAKAIGWICGCFVKEHLHQLYGQFPLLNLWGNASAGKSMTSYVLCRLSGMDYLETTQAVNLETSTPKPMRQYVGSSSTVPRVLEELNESSLSKARYSEAVAILKAAYNSSSMQRGETHGMTVTRVKSPLLYLSEQRPDRPSVRNRTVEVMLTASNREKPGRAENFQTAFGGRHHLNRGAKALLDTALRLSVDDVQAMFEEVKDGIPDALDERPRYNFRVCLLGLNLLDRSLKRFDIDISEDIQMLKDALMNDINSNYAKIEKSLRQSEVDMVLTDLNQMACEPDDKDGLKPGVDYIRYGNWLSLDLARCFNRYRRFSRTVGQPLMFKRPDGLGDLLAGEVYFDRMEPDPNRPKTQRFVLDLAKMQDKGINTDNFFETQM